MPAAHSKTKVYPNGWKFRYSMRSINLGDDRVIAAVGEYLDSEPYPIIEDVERIAMNNIEESKVALRQGEMWRISYHWTCIAKQHVWPFGEKYMFTIKNGACIVLTVWEDTVFNGHAANKVRKQKTKHADRQKRKDQRLRQNREQK